MAMTTTIRHPARIFFIVLSRLYIRRRGWPRLVSEFLKQRRGDRRSSTALAVHDDVVCRRDVSETLRELPERDVDRARNVSFVPLVFVADVDHDGLVRRLFAGELVDRHLRHRLAASSREF